MTLRRSCMLVALGFVGTLGCKKKEPAPAEAAVEADEILLRASAAEQLGSASFAVVGEISRGERRAILVWPGMAEGGEPASALALVFEAQGDGWTPVADRIDLRAQGMAAIVETLGSGEHRVVRECGLAPDELAMHLQTHGKAFTEALDSSDSKAAVIAYEQMARAFAWEHVAGRSMLLDLLLTPAPKTWYCGAKGCTVESTWEGRRRMQTFGHEDCGEGTVVGPVLAAQP